MIVSAAVDGADVDYHDAAGNRTKSVVTGTKPGTLALTFNTANQLTGPYGYDGAGNETRTNGEGIANFNTAGQQTTVVKNGTTITYTFAGTNENEFLSESTPAGMYRLAYGRTGANRLPEIEKTTAPAASAWLINDPTGLPIMLESSTNNTNLYMYDTRGNPLALATSANTITLAIRYDPYGAANRTDTAGNNTDAVNNPYLYGHGVSDRSNGRIKFGQRWYDPNLGSWMQQEHPQRSPRPRQTPTATPTPAMTPSTTPTPPGRDPWNDFAGAVEIVAGLGGLVSSIPEWASCGPTVGLGCAAGLSTDISAVGLLIDGINRVNSDGSGWGPGQWWMTNGPW